MKCGMVRKVDELGRVVIPKEIRRVLNIKTGSSIEMFIAENNQIVLKKFSEVKNVLGYVEILLELLGDFIDCPIFVCDEDEIVGCKNASKKEYIGKKISFENSKDDECSIIINESSIFEDKILKKENVAKNHIFKIQSSGFVCGYVILFCSEDLIEKTKSQVEILIKFISKILEF